MQSSTYGLIGMENIERAQWKKREKKQRHIEKSNKHGKSSPNQPAKIVEPKPREYKKQRTAPSTRKRRKHEEEGEDYVTYQNSFPKQARTKKSGGRILPPPSR